MTTKLEPTPAHSLAEMLREAVAAAHGARDSDAKIYDVDPWKSQFGVDIFLDDEPRRFRIDVVETS